MIKHEFYSVKDVKNNFKYYVLITNVLPVRSIINGKVTVRFILL